MLYFDKATHYSYRLDAVYVFFVYVMKTITTFIKEKFICNADNYTYISYYCIYLFIFYFIV